MCDKTDLSLSAMWDKNNRVLMGFVAMAKNAIMLNARYLKENPLFA